MLWKKEVEDSGIGFMQRVTTYRHHSLEGRLKQAGVRSISLSYGYRGYYRLEKNEIIFVTVEDVNNHDYKAVERLFGG